MNQLLVVPLLQGPVLLWDFALHALEQRPAVFLGRPEFFATGDLHARRFPLLVVVFSILLIATLFFVTFLLLLYFLGKVVVVACASNSLRLADFLVTLARMCTRLSCDSSTSIVAHRPSEHALAHETDTDI